MHSSLGSLSGASMAKVQFPVGPASLMAPRSFGCIAGRERPTWPGKQSWPAYLNASTCLHRNAKKQYWRFPKVLATAAEGATPSGDNFQQPATRRSVLLGGGLLLGGALGAAAPAETPPFLQLQFPVGGNGDADASALEDARAMASWGKGKLAIVTGGNTGIGKATAKELARRGYRVIIACRSLQKGQAAVKDIQAETGSQEVVAAQLDLASLRSVASFSSDFLRSNECLHVLVNNAGVMAHPQAYTEDGYEMHFGVNYLGHMALTQRLLPALREGASRGPTCTRVINVSSAAHMAGSLDFLDLSFTKGRPYDRWLAYGQSKLCNILFRV
eukprot:jgi/Mesvir1/6604/Mv25143-RA.1